MQGRVIHGAIQPDPPPEITDEEWESIGNCFRVDLDETYRDHILELRRIYWTNKSIVEKYPTRGQIEGLIREFIGICDQITRLVMRVSHVDIVGENGVIEASSEKSEPELLNVYHVLNQKAGAEFRDGFGELVHGSIRLRRALAADMDLDSATIDVRDGRAAGLRFALWFFRGSDPRPGGPRPGEYWGLSSGGGQGRGAPRVREFLTIVTRTKVSSDDIKSRIAELMARLPEEGNRQTKIRVPVSEFPNLY